MEFSDSEEGHRPYMLPCGHTICLRCLRILLAKSVRQSDKKVVQCPFDKSTHEIKHSLEKDLPINYSIIKGLNAFKKNLKKER